MNVANKKILLVEDDAKTRDAIAHGLIEFGCDVLSAGNAEIALKFVQKEAINAVLCDLGPDGKEGIEVFKSLSNTAPQCPVILIATGAQVDCALEGLANGAMAFISKPFKIPELAWLIQRALRSGSSIMVKATETAVP